MPDSRRDEEKEKGFKVLARDIAGSA